MGKKTFIDLNNNDGFKILGLDVSSSTVGVGLVCLKDGVITLSKYGHIKPIKSDKGTLLHRLVDLKQDIQEILELWQPNAIRIEDIITFMKNRSTARTITVLASFNRTVGLTSYEYNPNTSYLSVHEIRRAIKEEYNLNKVQKEDIPELIRTHLSPAFEDIIKVNRKGEEKIADETYDRADGIAVAWSYAIRLKNK
jgi:Holliday junction resolvasome RuvABC endonuclease subunit